MSEPTTDERLSIALVPTMQTLAVVHQTFAAVAEDQTPLGKQAIRQAEIQDQIGERLLEVSNALAEGTVRIVDEAALVHQVAQLMTDDGDDWEKNISSAQNLVLKIWKSTGVLR